jgi:hypothetical protein
MKRTWGAALAEIVEATSWAEAHSPGFRQRPREQGLKIESSKNAAGERS